MRVITQDKMLDIPYTRFAFSITKDGVILATKDIVCRCEELLSRIVAKYSTKEKAQKVMKMLRNEYMKNGSKNVYFQFPADEDVIV